MYVKQLYVIILNSFFLGKLDPVTLVFVGFSLATLEYFPEDLLKKMFTIEFLARLDSQLESMYLHFTFGIY